jgi:hypothetical protein
VVILPETKEIEIVEDYRDYTPPFDAERLVRELLRTVPQKYLQGLDCVLLTNQAALPREGRVGKVWSRGRKLDKSRIRGRYWPGSRNRLPYIELRVDKIATTMGKVPGYIPFLRQVGFGHVLFHEIGHHVHHTIRPEYAEKEDVADDWAGKLNANFIRKKYWYALFLLVPAAKLYKFMKRKQWV